MWLVISSIVAAVLFIGAISMRNAWVLDTFKSYGAYAGAIGVYAYRKYGLWHIRYHQFEGKAAASQPAKTAPWVAK